MRKIERAIIDAIQYRKAGRLSVRDEVMVDSDIVRVKLHYTVIATIDYSKKTITLDSGYYRTPTTKSRINAALCATTSDYRIGQVNYSWCLYGYNGKETVDFFDGIVLDF